jgi:hypothetical protein
MPIRKTYEALTFAIPQRDGDAARVAECAKQVVALGEAYATLDAKAMKAVESGDFAAAQKIVAQCVEAKAKLDAQTKRLETLKASARKSDLLCGKLHQQFAEAVTARVKDELEHIAKHEARIAKASRRVESAIVAAMDRAEAKQDDDAAKAQRDWDAEWGQVVKAGGKPDEPRPQTPEFDRKALEQVLRTKHKLTADELAKVQAAQARIAAYRAAIARKQAKYKAMAAAVDADSAKSSGRNLNG